eukprot:SAG22_NODE_5158_length_1074_cov_3.284740_1_plen_71_part_10
MASSTLNTVKAFLAMALVVVAATASSPGAAPMLTALNDPGVQASIRAMWAADFEGLRGRIEVLERQQVKIR